MSDRSGGSSSSSEMSRLESAVLPFRAVGHFQVCVVLTLVVGFMLLFSYQSEIQTFELGNGRAHGYGVLAARAGSSSDSSGIRSIVKKPVLKVLQSSDDGSSKRLQRKLESEPTSSNSSIVDDDDAAAPPPPAKKKDWKDVKVEEYKPLVASAHSNIVSTRFQFVIKVLALNDYDSISRCLNSLSEAEYAGDEVDIHIYIDHFEINSRGSDDRKRRRSLLEAEVRSSEDGEEESCEARIEKGSDSGSETSTRKSKRSSKNPARARILESDDDEDSKPAGIPDRVATGVESVKVGDWDMVEERLSEARRVVSYAESFYWKLGKKVIHYRTTTAGSQSQWLDAWWPSSDDEFALFVEDDAELSPLFYRYARSLIATYYYQPSQYDRLLYGISLQRPQIVPGKNGRKLEVDDRTRLFKYQMVGIWGQIFFPRPWKEFREWYDSKKSHDTKPVVDGMVTTDWYIQHGEKVFTPWFVKFAYNRGYYNLYTNFLRDRVLSVTHRNTGGKSKKYSGCDSVLIWENGTYDIDLWHMANNWHIKKYDFCFKEINGGRFANYTSDLSWILYSAAGESKQLLMLSVVGLPEVLARNWLCTLRKLGVGNYIVVGEDPVFLEYLARRGHATMRFDNKLDLTRTIEKEVGAVADALDLGYSVWFARADTIWLGNPLDVVTTEGADIIGLEDIETKMFFIRSTPETTPLWRSLTEELSSVAVNASRVANWKKAKDKFVKACEEEEKIRTSKLEEVVFTEGDGLSEAPTLEGEGSADSKVFLFPGLRALEDDDIKDKLQRLELWNLGDDWACAKLVC